jgi:glycosyltransferase involved in cell wall biosynthesis
MLNDHEPEFHGTSVERILAERTYGLGLHGLAGSPWLEELYSQYGGTASPFDYGVDHAIYKPHAGLRRRETVVFYGRSATPRRAVPLGLQALHALRLRRPGVRIVVFGEHAPLDASFDYEHVGVPTPEQLASLFSEGTAGLCLSLTNYSLIPQEMMACGMPCVELDVPSTRVVFGADAPVTLAGFDADALADGLARLLDDDGEWQRRSRAGIAWAASRTWARSALQVEAGLREALRRSAGLTA